MVDRERGEHVRAAGEDDHAEAVPRQLAEQPAREQALALEPVRREVGREHGT